MEGKCKKCRGEGIYNMQTKSSECLERMFCDCVEGVRLENLHRKMLKKSCELENGNDKCITALKLLRKDIRARKLVDKEPFPTYQKVSTTL